MPYNDKAPSLDFTEKQLERYSRHIILKEVGVEGQERIMTSKVLIIGAGGLGSPAAFYLAAAGIGTLGLVDGDTVNLSNLQRQIIHFTQDIGVTKVSSAQNKLQSLNPDITVKTYHEVVRGENIRDLIREYDVILDATDNFASKFLINDACIMENKPFSHGGVLQFTGQTITILPGKSACYRCVFQGPPPKDAVPTCSEAGVLGAIPGMLGTLQATEVLKLVAQIGTPLTNTLLTFDALTMDFRKVPVRKRSDCAVCGTSPTITTLCDSFI